MASGEKAVGTSFDSFDEAARSAFDAIAGAPHREGLGAAEVSRLWLTKGGVVGRVQFHAELVSLRGGDV
jgi:hypothetical protein